MIKIKKSAFTLVELIVVITILAILGTIAFLSFQGYSRDARDSKRTADINNIVKSLELFSLNTGKYPKPDNFKTITYSGLDLRYQGLLGDQVTVNLKSLNEKPLDPLMNTEYIYSVTNSYKEYEILALYEGAIAYQTSHEPYPLRLNGGTIFSQANAAITSFIPKIDGTYNQVFVKTANYIVPTPSIITSEILDSTIILDNFNIKSQVITNGENIPKNLLTATSTGKININLSVYTGSISLQSTDTEKVNAIKQIKNAYTSTVLSTKTNILYILNQTGTGKIVALSDLIFNNKTVGVSSSDYLINNSSGGGNNLSITISFIQSDNQVFTCALCN